MVKLSNAIIKAGVESFNTNRAFMSESQLQEREVHDRYTMELADIIKKQNSIDESKLVIGSESFESIESVKECGETIFKSAKEANLSDKMNIYAENSYSNGIGQAYTSCISVLRGGPVLYENGALAAAAKVFKNQLNDRQRFVIETTIDRDITALREACKNSEADKETKNIVSKTILEFMDIKKYL